MSKKVGNNNQHIPSVGWAMESQEYYLNILHILLFML